MSESNAPKAKNKVWSKQLRQPLPKWHTHQGATNDCGPFAASIVANALHNAPVIDPPTLARSLEGPPAVRGGLIPARISGWATFPWGLVRSLRRLGLRARWRLLATEARLKRNLDAGRPTIVIIGQPFRVRRGKYAGWSHYLTVYAWDPDEGWAFVDSQAPDGGIYSYRDPATFRRLWTNVGRQLIEVEQPDVPRQTPKVKSTFRNSS